MNRPTDKAQAGSLRAAADLTVGRRLSLLSIAQQGEPLDNGSANKCTNLLLNVSLELWCQQLRVETVPARKELIYFCLHCSLLDAVSPTLVALASDALKLSASSLKTCASRSKLLCSLMLYILESCFLFGSKHDLSFYIFNFNHRQRISSGLTPDPLQQRAARDKH